ncbi:RNA recognition motif domain-containing protein [Planctomycetota bacterium]
MLKNIYVGNLSFNSTEDDVRTLFEQFGSVQRVNIVLDRETGRPRGFGFVEMSDEAEGQTAIEKLDGTELDGRNLKVNEAKPRASRSGGGRRW